MEIVQRYPLTSYFTCSCAWSWSLWLYLSFTSLSPESLIWKGLFVIAVSGPLVASTAVSFLLGGKAALFGLFRKTFTGRHSPWCYFSCLSLPPGMMILAASFFGDSFWDRMKTLAPSLPLMIPTFLWLAIRSGPVNEEYGWRGFLLPRLLHRHSPAGASLIVGTGWACWHWPLWFVPGVPHHHWPFTLFFLLVIPMSFLFTWFHLRTKGNILIAIVFHTSINTSMHLIPILPPGFPDVRPLVAWILVAACAAAALVLISPRMWLVKAAGLPVVFSGMEEFQSEVQFGDGKTRPQL